MLGQDAHYALLASAVLGRAASVGRDPSAHTASWSDGAAIWFDPNHDEDIASAVMIQAALIRAGSLDQRIAAGLVGRPTLARRYLALEAPRAILASSDRLPRRLLAHPAVANAVVLSGSPRDSLAVAASRGPIAEPHPLLGMLRPAAVLRTAPPPAPHAAAERRTMQARTEGAMLPQPPHPVAEASRLLKSLSMLELAGGPLSKLIKHLFGHAMRRTGQQALAKGGARDFNGTPGRSSTPAAVTISRRKQQTAAGAAPAPFLSVYRYDEWDEARNLYRRGWTRVEDFVPTPSEAAGAPAPIASPTRRMRRQLATLQLGFEPHRHQPAGDDIVLDDLVRMAVQIRAGQPADPRIYRAVRKTSRELGVLLLIDTSSSVQDATDGGGTVQQHQLELAGQIARTLDDAGDRVALYGFNGQGRERVCLLRVKSFDERISGQTARRLARLVPAGFTRIGAALRHAGRVVAEQSGMKYRLVVLLTDGFSYDEGYEASHGEADTRKAIAELHASQIGCVCISVGGGDTAQLMRVFGEAAFVQARRPEQAITQLAEIFRQAINRKCRGAVGEMLDLLQPSF